MRRGTSLLVVAAVSLVAAGTITVVRPGSGRTTADPLVVAGGIPPDPPATGAGVEARAPSSGRTILPARGWGSAGRYGAWAYQIGSRVPIAPRTLAAYALGERYAAGATPACGVSWVTLAAIGSVESDHGRFRGAAVGDDGQSTPAVVGPPLDGRPGVQAIPDTDDGAVDGDRRWDRAVGPMQFLPGSWRRWGVDADLDGVARPHDLDDAAATAAVYLCASTDTMRSGPGWWAAVTTYNRSATYARDVLVRSNEYAAASVR